MPADQVVLRSPTIIYNLGRHHRIFQTGKPDENHFEAHSGAENEVCTLPKERTILIEWPYPLLKGAPWYTAQWLDQWKKKNHSISQEIAGTAVYIPPNYGGNQIIHEARRQGHKIYTGRSVRDGQLGSNMLVTETGRYFIWMGQLKGLDDDYLYLNQSSWIASTGYANIFLSTGKDAEMEIEPHLPGQILAIPRAISDVIIWPHELLTEPQ
jgi:hypothetical protein